MTTYRQLVDIDAHQWFRNGDHPLDGPRDREGQIVRYWRTPEFPGNTRCPQCGDPMHAHGWLDTDKGGSDVCPGDWIVTTADGDHTVYTAAAFATNFEAVADPS